MNNQHTIVPLPAAPQYPEPSSATGQAPSWWPTQNNPVVPTPMLPLPWRAKPQMDVSGLMAVKIPKNTQVTAYNPSYPYYAGVPDVFSSTPSSTNHYITP